jgi:hypothetical protein
MLRGQDDFWGNLVEAAMFETCLNLLLCIGDLMTNFNLI